MTVRGHDIVPGAPLMPIAGGTLNSEAFTVPRGTVAMTVYCPSLVGTTTLKIEALVPQENDTITDVWLPLATFDFSGATPAGPIALDEIPESTATTIPGPALGGGVLRFVASADQSSAPVRIPLGFTVSR